MAERIVKVVDSYGYARMLDDLNKLCRAYSSLQLSYIGESVMGRPIPVIQIGHGAVQVHYNGAIHANEWITSLLLMVYLEDYAAAMASDGMIFGHSARQLAMDTSLYIVPMVNPDGVELVHSSSDYSHWKSNIRGIDLNDQFPAHWELEKLRRSPDQPGPRDYPGECPLSEPEALALAEYTKYHDFQLVVALHTQGREIYWNYRDYEPEQAAQIVERLASASGYTAIQLTDSDAGYKDWFIQEYRRPGFTVEAGYGSNPLPINQFEVIYTELLPILVLCVSLPMKEIKSNGIYKDSPPQNS